jgi:chaperonin GroEL (HSP60 family)
VEVSDRRKKIFEVMGISLVRWTKRECICIPLVGRQTNAMILDTKTEKEESYCKVFLEEIENAFGTYYIKELAKNLCPLLQLF